MIRALLIALLLLGNVAEAQSTGGRVGGFGGGSSGRSGSGFMSWSSSSSSSSSSSMRHVQTAAERAARRASDDAYHRWRDARREAGIPEASELERELRQPQRVFGSDSMQQGALAFLLGFVVVGLVGLFVGSFVTKRHRLRRISLAFGGDAVATLQHGLREIAAQHSAATPAGRAAIARAALALMATGAPLYAFWQNEKVRRGVGEKRFRQLAQDLRTRFKHETVGAHQSSAERATPGATDGLLVVSLLGFHAASKPLELPADLDPARALAAMTDAEGQPIGLELIWSPSESSDVMRSTQLEVLYPELVALSDAVGRVRCPHCSAIYAKELGACTGCGCPAPT